MMPMHQLTADAGADINRSELVLTDAYPIFGETLQDMHCANEVRYVCVGVRQCSIEQPSEWKGNRFGLLKVSFDRATDRLG